MMNKKEIYDVIVVGAGHAGCEAALACARRGCKTLLITMNLDRIALMSCNPSIGGIGKGHLVKEIDALGGEIGKVADETAIQFRMLNMSKGPAVRASRTQNDRILYSQVMKNRLEREKNLTLRQDIVESIIVEDREVKGVTTIIGITYFTKALILTTGTFLNGLIHVGLSRFQAGRAGDFPAIGLSESLKKLGFRIERLKTGTPPRLNKNSIDFSKLGRQDGDKAPIPFSFSNEKLKIEKQLPCYITFTNLKTHEIIRNNLDKSPLYSGIIVGKGPRYCPSIEDKVVKFKEKDHHQIFLEPEGLTTDEIYPNGISTSLPFEVQVELVRSIEGLENAVIERPGYAIEYDFVPPDQLFPSLETKLIKNLYHAGQINGTTGYEEAAAQGLIAGINASLKIEGKEPLILSRSQGYIGVLIDDLVTKGVDEPYRVFTSRAEYRLILREDNADLRLRDIGYKLGLVSENEYLKFKYKKELIEKGLSILSNTKVKSGSTLLNKLESYGIEGAVGLTLKHILKRPNVKLESIINALDGELDFLKKEPLVAEQITIQTKYEGYIERQQLEIERFDKMENKIIPEDFDYNKVKGLSHEVREKLNRIKPRSIGQASRISGLTPAAISNLLIYLKKGTKFEE